MQALREKLIEERMTRRENEMRLNEKVERARMEAQIKEKIEITMLLSAERDAERGAMLQQMHNLQREVSSLRAHQGTLQPMLMPSSDPVQPQASNSTASSLQMLEAEQAAGARRRPGNLSFAALCL